MLFLITIITIIVIYLWFKRKFSFWNQHGFPHVPGKIPLGSVGNIGFKEHSTDFFARNYEKLKYKGPAFGIYFGVDPALIPTDPELIKDIFVRNFENFHDRGIVLNKQGDPLSGHLFMLSGQEWKDLRAKLSTTFTSGKMKMMFPIVSSSADRMIDYIKQFAENGTSFEIKEILASFTTEVIANVAFGLEIKCLGNPQNQFRKMAKRVFEPPAWETIKVFFMVSFPKVSKLLNLGFNTQETTEFFMGTVRDTLNYREKNKVQRNDFFQFLINIKNSDVGMTFDEIAANSFIFFVAGFETSSSATTFCIYELAVNLDIQKRLRDEIEEIVAKYNGEVTYDAIMEMKYLDMVFNETLRKYPVLDMQFRKCVNDFPIRDTKLVIPAGTRIVISSHALHHDERFYENPEKFDPERFTPENILKRQPFTYIPFSEGPRICIGLRFGTMQSKIAIVKILRNFRIFLSEKTKVPIKFIPNAAFQSAEGGIWLKLEKLN